MTSPTYKLSVIAGTPAIRCLLCSRISELAGDIENRYCGRCHLFHDVVAEARLAHAEGAGHECDEWQTYRGVCAVCGDPDPTATLGALVGELAEREHPIELVLRPVSAFQIASLLQVALRHPGVAGDVRRVGLTVIEHVRAYFADAPTVSAVLRQGDDPAHDVPTEREIEIPQLYDVARRVTHEAGMPWTDPRTGQTYPPVVLRVRHRVRGGHVHCRVFTAPINETFVKAGDLTFTVAEWPALFALLAPLAECLPEED